METIYHTWQSPSATAGRRGRFPLPRHHLRRATDRGSGAINLVSAHRPHTDGARALHFFRQLDVARGADPDFHVERDVGAWERHLPASRGGTIARNGDR